MAGIHLSSIKNTHDQPWQGIQVQALVRALGAGRDYADLPFARYLMERQEATIRESHLNDGNLAAYDRLLEILRGHLENELEETLAQFQIMRLSPSRVANLSAAFWASQTVHIELFFRQDPITGQPLCGEAGGEYQVMQG